MRIFYLLSSVRNLNRVYVGVGGNVKRRLEEHNRGEMQNNRGESSVRGGCRRVV